MLMTAATTLKPILARARRRLASEQGFTMLIALGALTVTSLLVAAMFVAVTGDVKLTQHDLDGKRAYYAARAGENAFLYQLNQNPDYWSTCANDYQPTPVTVPGSTAGEMYSYVPVYNPGYSSGSCTTTNAIAALIDATSGTLRMEFTGYAGTPSVSRTIVASFRKASPLDYLWYTDHEMKDPALNTNCTNEKYYYQYSSASQAPSGCTINWVTGDVMSGPLYTNDQYLIYNNAAPVFGRSGSNDVTESSAPKIYGICVSNNCQKAKFQGQGAVPGAQSVALPTTNSKLLADATANGTVITGTTTINLTGNSALVTNCPDPSSSVACQYVNQPISTPIIYVKNAAGCPSAYALNTTYGKNNQNQYYGACGDVYLTGSYTTPLTIVTDHDIIILANNGSSTGVTTTQDSSGNPTGNATLGLVAADFVRVMHTAGTNSNPVTIDAAILTLSHSFMVDNYDSGGGGQPKLTVYGAIAQRYRGTVGTTGGTGYLKNYHYDDRLQVMLPPYMFDIAISDWKIVRETLCTQTSDTTNAARCSYQGL
jgi:hypothetical protein